MPDSPSPVPSAEKQLSVKQQREARRAHKIALLAQQQARQKRNRLIGIVSAIAGAALVIVLVIVFVVTSTGPRLTPAEVTVQGVKLYPDLTATHVNGTVNYPVTPPVGGNHNPAWLNCGFYTQKVPNENAVHSLEHGAVWITYDPGKVSEADREVLRKRLPDTYVILSPFPGIPSPVVASAWGAQLELTDVNDSRLDVFITKYWKSAEAPEPGALCTGAIDGPGRVS